MEERNKNTTEIPLIVVSDDLKSHEIYLKSYLKSNAISPYFVFHIIPEKSELGIDQIKLVRHEIFNPAAEIRLFVFESFDRASLEAQNALLKTLEESTLRNRFYFQVQQLEKIIPTVRSRSRVVILDGSLLNPKKIDEKINEFYVHVKRAKSYDFLGNDLIKSQDKEEALNFLKRLLEIVKKDFVSGEFQTASIAKRIIRMKSLLESNNLNSNMTVDNVLIFINKVYKIK